MKTPHTYLVLFRFCLLSVLSPESPALSSLAADAVDWSRDVSYSPSPSLESARWYPSDTGPAEEERGGGGKVASLIVEDIHSIPMLLIEYFSREEYLKVIRIDFAGCSPKRCCDMEMGFAGDLRSNRVDVTAIRLRFPRWALFQKEREHNIYSANHRHSNTCLEIKFENFNG
jgi:hypothetical protein